MKRPVLKPPSAESPAARSLAPLESKLLASVPNVVDHMAVTRYEDGSPRVPGLVMLQTYGTSWVVILKDTNGDVPVEIRAIGSTLDDALVLAELFLGANDPPWVPDKWAMERAAQKKKK